MMRFHPLICDLKEIISNEYYGKLISIQSKWAEFLPDWHPWEDYRISYASNKKMGGGVALTLSHDIDLAFFLTSSKLQNFSNELEFNTAKVISFIIGKSISKFFLLL